MPYAPVDRVRNIKNAAVRLVNTNPRHESVRDIHVAGPFSAMQLVGLHEVIFHVLEFVYPGNDEFRIRNKFFLG